MSATTSTITRPRSLTTSTSVSSPHPHSPRYSNFRPVRYQTKEELDRFFGTTTHQKREQRLRVRESDGQVYYDWIEKDEWQHLLASASTHTSPAGAETAAEQGRRRSSVATFLTLNSPLSPGTPRRGSVGGAYSAKGMSPLTGSFGHVRLAEGEGERRGRKRSSSALAGRSVAERVDDETPLGGLRPSFKRRQSDMFDPTSHDDQVQQSKDKIRLARLPLARHKLDREALDAAFAINPLLDLAPDATLAPCSSFVARKPSALQIPISFPSCATLVDDDPADSCCSSPLHSPMTLQATSARRGTFGPAFPQATQPTGRLRRASDVGTTPPSSSALMEFLASPSPSTTSYDKIAKVLRHAASFDTPRTTSFPDSVGACITSSAGKWAQRQRWHADGKQTSSNEPKLRAVRSVASLRESAGAFDDGLRTPVSRIIELPRLRKVSNSSSGSSGSSCEPCFTPLAPRTGAKKYDRTREQHLNLATSPNASSPPTSTPASIAITLPPMTDPVSPASAGSKEKSRMGTGLRTGPEVYQGVDIPCASIHLHSDPEDNVEPALALSLSASKLKKLKKTARAQAGHARCPSISGSSIGAERAPTHPKGSSRWWSNILHP